jgi:alanyl-tRNA synthetase
MLTAAVQVADSQALLELADRLKGKLGDAAIVLGRAGDGRVDLIASVAPALVSRGVRADEIVKIAAAEVGGGGGGRDTLARAGGRDPERLDAAIDAAQAAIEAALNS